MQVNLAIIIKSCHVEYFVNLILLQGLRYLEYFFIILTHFLTNDQLSNQAIQPCLTFMFKECLVKVYVPNLVIYLHRTPRFELCVLCCGSKNKYLQDTIFEEIGLHTQITITILISMVNIIGVDLYDQNDHKNRRLRYSYEIQKYDESGYDIDLDLLIIHLVLS